MSMLYITIVYSSRMSRLVHSNGAYGRHDGIHVSTIYETFEALCPTQFISIYAASE